MLLAACMLAGLSGAAFAELSGKQIADAHGMYPLPEFESITYTFNVQLGEKNIQRTWTWWPGLNQVKDHTAGITYQRDEMDPQAIESDKKFINDHYWLFFPWHLATDHGSRINTHQQY